MPVAWVGLVGFAAVGLAAVAGPEEVYDFLVDAVTREDVQRQIWGWLSDAAWSLFQVALIVIISLLALRLLRSSVRGIVARIIASQEQPPRELEQRARTLANVVESAGKLVIFIVAVMMILTNIGLEIGPLIASAGLAGIALGLGAQTLVSDTINGFFILFENQYGVGDVIKVDQLSGTVEEVNLRRTVLRSVNGAQVIIPNGQIRAVENLSKGWSRAVIDIETAPTADDSDVVALLHQLLDSIQDDPELGQHILEPPQILGINAISVTGVTFRILVKTEPLQQWTVERELRLRIREAFRANGIAVPVLTSATISPAG